MASTGAPDPQIGPIVTEWRALNTKITERTKECEAIREKVNKLKQDHGSVASAWEEQRLATEHTIDAVMQHVAAKKQELSTMEKETLALSAKVQERQKKIDENTRIIVTREEAVDRTFKTALEKETAAKGRLQDFRDARDVAKTKLARNIEKLEAMLPAESEEHSRRLQQLAAQTEEIERRIAQERQQWDMECARRDLDAQLTAQKLLLTEIQAAGEAKTQWSDALNALSAQSHRYASMTNELAQLRHLVRPLDN